MKRKNTGVISEQPIIRQLDDVAANRIAAGEVVERPRSVVKELIENAIDAKASRIEITYANGGKTLIRVSDNGHGISQDQLQLALSRHATSKIDGSDLLNIHTFGFRGEALPSMGAVGRLTITSRTPTAKSGAEISVDGGDISPVRPAALNKGTVVELRDLFYTTPARLKFLRTDRSEAQEITDVVKRLAMAEPYIGFILRDVSEGGEGRITFRADPSSGDLFDALHTRLRIILGKDFIENSILVDTERDGMSLTGYISLPTYSRGTALAQYLFINGRPIKDRLLLGALRAAYSDFLGRGRYPIVALFLECDPESVDVNVHPAKAEVRFRDPGIARGLLVSGLRHALANAGHRASSTIGNATLGAFKQEERNHAPHYQMNRPSSFALRANSLAQQPGFNQDITSFSGRVEPHIEAEQDNIQKPLGAARAQIHENYIISQTQDGLIIVDQHAAHERLVYEKLKRQMATNGITTQVLLIPEIVELSEDDCQRLLAVATELNTFGLVIESFGGSAIAIRETPAILGEINASALIKDILDELTYLSQTQTIKDRIEEILSRVACHGSIRSGRLMRGEEMNALLREMETTPHSGQCNHGRPTYVELKLKDIERLFGRT